MVKSSRQKAKMPKDMDAAEKKDFYAWRTEKVRLQREKIKAKSFMIDNDIVAFSRRTIMNDTVNGVNEVPIIEYIKEMMYEGKDPEYIRQQIGITQGRKDKRWQRLIRLIRDSVISEDLVVQTVKRYNDTFDMLEWINTHLQKDFIDCNDKDTKVKFAGEIRKNCMDAAQLGNSIIKMGIELGSIIPGEASAKPTQPIVIINQNIPRPNLDPENAPTIEVHKSGTIQKYNLGNSITESEDE